MIIECCSQERSYSTFYGLIGERFCKLNRVWNEAFERAFTDYFMTIHRYETNRLRNIARFFGHLLSTDSISWAVMECIKLTEEDTTSSSRIFIKIMCQEMTESMGLKVIAERFKDDEVKRVCSGMFPMDNPKNTRFAINYFTSIGLGVVTEEMREHLKVRSLHALLCEILIKRLQNAPRLIMEQRRAMLEAESSSSDSSDSDSSDDSDSATDSSSDNSDSDDSEDSEDSRRSRRRGSPPRNGRAREDSRSPPPRGSRRSPSPYRRYDDRDRDRRREDRDADRYNSRRDSPPRRRDYTPERRDRDRERSRHRSPPRSPSLPPRSRRDRSRSRSGSPPRARDSGRGGRNERDDYDRRRRDEKERPRDRDDYRERRRYSRSPSPIRYNGRDSRR